MGRFEIAIASAVGSSILTIGALEYTEVIPPLELELTCDVAAEKLWAVRQCLKFQPLCPSLSVEGFADYHQIRYWSNVNCPDMDSGGDFLPQSKPKE